jgi:SAM-dependent methyltransferase
MRAVHPFPARMAPEVVLGYLPATRLKRRVLDPMAGSGTTLAAARMRGFQATGIDSDPLAVLIARAACCDLNPSALRNEGERVLRSAEVRTRRLLNRNAYPYGADAETCAFIDYWFDARSRIQLTALARALTEARPRFRDFLRCAFSRMIISKGGGVSLGEDVSHSRPHRTRDRPPTYPFEAFGRSLEAVIRASDFTSTNKLPKAHIAVGDCRNLPFESKTFDYVITSPPYLNAIDYLRGHKLSLVWFGHAIADLRALRSRNIGTEVGTKEDTFDDVVDDMVTSRRRPTDRLRNRLRRYVGDLNIALREMRRVAKDGGKIVLVIGDCTIEGCDVRNSVAIDLIARANGFSLRGRRARPLLARRRYLPPPSKALPGEQLRTRLWEELILCYEAS